jgi:VanZ family protein
VHFSFFLAFFLLWSLSFPPSFKSTLFIWVLSVVYGFGIEFYQLHFVAGRSFDVWDGISDSLGAATGWLCIRVFNRQE